MTVEGEKSLCDRYGCKLICPTSANRKKGSVGHVRAVAAWFLKGRSAVTTSKGGRGPACCRRYGARAAGIRGTHGLGAYAIQHFPGPFAASTPRRRGRARVHQHRRIAEMVEFLGMGQVDLGLMPYTSSWRSTTRRPVKIVAGGARGLRHLAPPGSIAGEAQGQDAGHIPARYAEVMPYDYLKKHGIPFKDVKVATWATRTEAVEASKAVRSSGSAPSSPTLRRGETM